ncbi:hypothetical protein BAUCODRAFT_144036, partial [Baudoinia panamericana UAMH 10762]
MTRSTAGSSSISSARAMNESISGGFCVSSSRGRAATVAIMRRGRSRKLRRLRRAETRSHEETHNRGGRSDVTLGSGALRIAYVNVRGLDHETWERLLALIAPGKLDLIFVAETWYMGFERYTAAPATIAFTPRPPTKTGARYNGGLC